MVVMVIVMKLMSDSSPYTFYLLALDGFFKVKTNFALE